jgi:hypothetical protein
MRMRTRARESKRQSRHNSSKALSRSQLVALRELAEVMPRTDDQLHRFIDKVLGLQLPRKPMITGHDAPFDYVKASFFESITDGESEGDDDLIVWANRGGGKTMLGAVVTLLDMLFKPGISIRILEGSMEQSSRMYAYLRQMLERPWFTSLIKGTPTGKRVELINASTVELLAQSARSVRGQRVHKLRCDEVDEFDHDIWKAAQMVTQSGKCGEVEVQGTIESLSTMHRPFGLMHQLVEQARDTGKPRVMRWSVFDVIEKCPPSRSCDNCVLVGDCQGIARNANGYMRVDDVIRQWHRTDKDTWQAEMLCQRPRRDAQVFARFDSSSHGSHVRTVDFADTKIESGAAVLQHQEANQIVAGMDFGIRGKHVMLWAKLTLPSGPAYQDKSEQKIEVFDEYVAKDRTLDENMDAIEARKLPKPIWLGVDPSGSSRNQHTGLSDIQMLRKRGYRILHRRSHIADGIADIRRRLDHGTLTIDPRCKQLIQSLSTYHFDPKRPDDPNPVKMGPTIAAMPCAIC